MYKTNDPKRALPKKVSTLSGFTRDSVGPSVVGITKSTRPPQMLAASGPFGSAPSVGTECQEKYMKYGKVVDCRCIYGLVFRVPAPPMVWVPR